MKRILPLVISLLFACSAFGQVTTNPAITGVFNPTSYTGTFGGSTCAFSSGGLNACAIGATTPAAGTFTTGTFTSVSATSNYTSSPVGLSSNWSAITGPSSFVGVINSSASATHGALVAYGANATGVQIFAFKTRAATSVASTIVANADEIFNVTGYGADGSAYRAAGQLLLKVDGTPGASDMPGRWEFWTTPDGSATPALALTIDNAKLATFAGAITVPTFTASGATVILSGLGSATGTPSSLCLNTTTVTVNAALTCTVSSERFKSDIRPFDGSALRMVSAMQPDTFFYKDRLDRNRIGLVAEDLAAIDPRLAEWDKDGRPNSIDFPAIMGVLVKAAQEQQAQIELLRQQRAQ